jgi:hypothetical protein
MFPDEISTSYGHEYAEQKGGQKVPDANSSNFTRSKRVKFLLATFITVLATFIALLGIFIVLLGTFIFFQERSSPKSKTTVCVVLLQRNLRKKVTFHF